MNIKLKELRYLFGFALVGACLAGSIFGFCFKLQELERIRLIGAITFSLISYYFDWHKIEQKNNNQIL